MILLLRYSLRLIILLLFIFSFSPTLSNAQPRVISGQITDASKQTIPWVNIGIKNKNVGAVSNSAGSYKITIPQGHLEDTISFSAVGFKTLNIPLKDFNQDKFNPSLQEIAITLSTVSITNKKPKVRKFGTTSYTPMLWAHVAKRLDDITEQGQLIKVKKPIKLLSAHVFTAGQKRGDSVAYRLNFYRVKDGQPDERLFEKSLIKKFPLTDKKYSFDLSNEDMVIDEDFVVSFEYLPNQMTENPPVVSFRANLGNSRGFFREISLGTWGKLEGGSAAIYVIGKE